ncbi:hypothetical protein PHYBOEH_008371 [Phytophthora boehmeriae]|uniref:RxLR effector protein n=1 Tax=Phytophthora boehmeriae TaxID=109152 RepID=A0A8T1W4R6_9STRA|nr:hypothetical protein PHYBOEH_008371 [Phytophthora boehmeriae]
MRLSHVLVVIAAAFLVTSEALLTASDSNQVKLSEVSSPQAESQRFLRTRHTTYEDDDNDEDDENDENDEDENEERALTQLKMKNMKKDKMTADDYAQKLGIFSKLNSKMTPREYREFLNSHKYDKYKTYYNFLH